MSLDRQRQRMSGFQRLSVATLAATLVLVAIGGAVRATDSGLACPDWPRCYGLWIPPADLNMWLEHSHRLTAGVVGIMIAVLLVWAIARHRNRPEILWPTVAAAVLVNVQAALGALVVLHLLRAELVTAHLGMAMAVVACLVLLIVGTQRLPRRRADRPARDLSLARSSLLVGAICYVQLLVGAHVTGVNAGLVFRDFPLMDGAIFPAIAGEREAFHVAHRLLAYTLAVAVVVLLVHARRTHAARLAAGGSDAAGRWLVRLPAVAVALVAVQIALGVANLWSMASWTTVVPHLAVASWIWTVLVFQTLLAYRHAPLADVPALADEDAPRPARSAPRGGAA